MWVKLAITSLQNCVQFRGGKYGQNEHSHTHGEVLGSSVSHHIPIIENSRPYECVTIAIPVMLITTL